MCWTRPAPLLVLLGLLALAEGCAAKGKMSAKDGTIGDWTSTQLDVWAAGDGPGGQGDTIRRDGFVPAKDSTPAIDQGVPDQPLATPMKIVITEIMADPSAVPDTDGEWIELFNPNTIPLDLGGWYLRDDGKDNHQIGGPLIIGAGQYMVLSRKSDITINGGVNSDYQYQSFILANEEDEVVLFNGAGQLVDRVAYATGWEIDAGVSLQLKDPSLDNEAQVNWCLAQSPWSGSAGDSGTPGAAAVCPPVPDSGI